jgi:hypothetical protein
VSQVALGLRSLLFKLSVFFVMAALLAWALGGTLWPRPERLRSEIVALSDDPAKGNRVWFAIDSEVGGREKGQVKATLVRLKPSRGTHSVTPVLPPPADDDEEREIWDEALAPVPVGPIDAAKEMWVAARVRGTEGWRLVRVGVGGEVLERLELPDRLEVERQLERVREGRAVQSAGAASSARAAVIEAGD